MILLDTDVLIDVALERIPFSEPASELLDQIERGKEAACMAWHTVANLHYLAARVRGNESAKEFIIDLTRFISVAATSTADILYAAQLPMNDFEDAMQVAAARSSGARLIITRNLRDYEASPIPAISPQGVLLELL